MKKFFKSTIIGAPLILVIILCGLSLVNKPVLARAAENPKKETKRVVRPSEIKFPSEYGRITEVFDSGGDELVIHIQDAHTNYEAQKNAASILEELINNYGLYLILVEGGSRDVSLNYYREGSSLEERKKTADQQLKEGVIAGEEYLNIASDYPMKLQGMEDRALYDQNMEAYLGVDKGKDAALLYTKLLSGVVVDLKFKLYNKNLKELDDKRRGFKDEKVSLADYANYLKGLAQAKKIDMSGYPNYKNLTASFELEKAIDFSAVEKERAETIEVLGKKIGEADLKEFLEKSVDFKSGKITPVQYHTYLKDMMVKAKMDIKQYPNLEKYIIYITNYEKINSAELFKELKSAEDKIEQVVATNDEQKRLIEIVKNLEFLIDFIELKLSPDDFDYYQKSEGNFNLPEWVRFLNSQAARFNLAQRVPEGTTAVEKIMPSVKNFYLIARKRDEVFLNNTQKYMKAEGVNIAALIAGGFHTPTLMRLFRLNNISYIVVSPKVLKPTDEKLYHKILTEGWAPAGQEAGTAEKK